MAVDDGRSVRIEVDPFGAGHEVSPQAPQPPSSSPGRTTAVVAGIVLLAIAAIAIVLLRPSEGETAAGTQRQASTTTAPTTTTRPTTTTSAVDVEPSASRIGPGESNGFQPVENGIISTGSGFLGVSVAELGDSGPLVFTSLDGSVWNRVETELIGDFPSNSPQISVGYSNLIATDDGFAVLQTTTTLDAALAGRVLEVQRFISIDGRSWEADPDFTPIESSAFPRPVLHLEDTIVVSEFGVPVDNSASTELIVQVLDPESEIDPSGLCFLPWSPTQLRGFECDGGFSFVEEEGGTVFIERTDLADPALFSAVRDCLEGIQFPGANSALSFIRRGEQAPIETVSGFSIGHTSFGDVWVASVLLGDLILGGENPCEEFPDVAFPEVQPAAIEINDLSSGGLIARIPLPEEVAASSIDEWQEPDVADAGGDVLAILDNAVWALNFETDDWRKFGDLPTAQLELASYRFTPDQRVVAVTQDGIAVVDFAAGETETIELDFDSGFWSIAYVDDEVVLLGTIGRPGIITVPLQ